jgi:hypothetical protein
MLAAAGAWIATAPRQDAVPYAGDRSATRSSAPALSATAEPAPAPAPLAVEPAQHEPEAPAQSRSRAQPAPAKRSAKRPARSDKPDGELEAGDGVRLWEWQ